MRRLAEQLLERCSVIDVLAHNAGGLIPERRVTEDGHEMTFQTNYLAPFLLQSLLHERLSASQSPGHRHQQRRPPDRPHRAGRPGILPALLFCLPVYGAAKLADLIFAREIARRAAETGITGSHSILDW